MLWQQNLILVGAAALAGMVNSVAGGGTLLTFPALLSTGFDAVYANATSTVALWPGQVSSLWGYRKELGQNRKAIVRLAIPSLLGGSFGAWLLLNTPHGLFKQIVPFLILLATILFIVQEPLSRWQKARSAQAAANSSDRQDVSSNAEAAPPGEPSPSAWVGVIVFQFFVAIYGGYFGAGIGIMMLATLGFMGFTNIHQMNGLKSINQLCINAVASILFIVHKEVDWHIALMMAIGSLFGGYAGADVARRIGQRNVRRVIIGIGLALACWLLNDSLAARRSAPAKHASQAHTIAQHKITQGDKQT